MAERICFVCNFRKVKWKVMSLRRRRFCNNRSIYRYSVEKWKSGKSNLEKKTARFSILVFYPLLFFSRNCISCGLSFTPKTKYPRWMITVLTCGTSFAIQIIGTLVCFIKWRISPIPPRSSFPAMPSISSKMIACPRFKWSILKKGHVKDDDIDKALKNNSKINK